MADPPPDGATDDDSGMNAERNGTGLAPWQKVVGIIGLLVVLVVIIALIAGGGHTPPVQHGMRLP